MLDPLIRSDAVRKRTEIVDGRPVAFYHANDLLEFILLEGRNNKGSPTTIGQVQHHRDRARRQLNALTTVADETRCAQRRGQAQDDR
jgi:hypothetical protein